MNNELENKDAQEPMGKGVVAKTSAAFKSWWKKNTSEPLKRREKAVLIVVAVLLLFLFYITLDANKYRATVLVVEGEGKVGINPTTEALDFGDLARGVSAVRRVSIENGTFMPMFITMFKTGEIGSLIKIDRNHFKLGAREQAKIEYTVYVPASAEIDHIYNGRVYLFKIPTFGL